MNIEGRIDVTLRVADGRVAEVAIGSSRPQLAQRLLGGRTPAEAADLAGMLFSLCGRAQRIAALAACAAAEGRPLADETARDHERAILAEWAREHAWRLLLDWPAVNGGTADPVSLQRLRQAGDDPAKGLDALLLTKLLGEPAAVWLERDASGLRAWLRAGKGAAALFAALGEGDDPGSGASDFLPPASELADADVAGLAERALAEPELCARPLWQGWPAETGALARSRSEPLLGTWMDERGAGAGARLLARLVELARLPVRLSGNGPAVLRAWPLAGGAGIAAVETSRGLLCHVVRLDAGRVADYRIVSPTEWNFHPRGALAEALAGLPADERLEMDAKRLVLAFDPCVAYGVEIAYA